MVGVFGFLILIAARRNLEFLRFLPKAIPLSQLTETGTSSARAENWGVAAGARIDGADVPKFTMLFWAE